MRELRRTSPHMTAILQAEGDDPCTKSAAVWELNEIIMEQLYHTHFLCGKFNH